MNTHPSTAEAIEEIDAAIFSGDTFLNEENNKEMQVLLDRWQRGLNEHKETILDLEIERKEGSISKHHMSEKCYEENMLALNALRRKRDQYRVVRESKI